MLPKLFSLIRYSSLTSSLMPIAADDDGDEDQPGPSDTGGKIVSDTTTPFTL
jgi:hypothetical protein